MEIFKRTVSDFPEVPEVQVSSTKTTSYFRLRWQRAVRDAERDIGHDVRVGAVYAFVGGVVGLGMRYYTGEPKEVNVLLFSLLSGLVGLFLTGAFYFLRHFFAAPSRIYWDQQKKIGELESQISSGERDSDPVLERKQERLRNFIRKGSEIRRLYESWEGRGYDDPDGSYWQWEEEVKAYLYNFFGISYQDRFINSNSEMLVPIVSGRIREEKQQNYLILYAQIELLRRIRDEMETRENRQIKQVSH